jgi:basic amino acid/polyamine antiporter, APA family
MDKKSRKKGKSMSIPKSGLRRDLNLISAVAVGLGAIIGAGIFVVTGVAASAAGPAFVIGLLLAGILATFNALSSAQLAAAYPQSGGTYEYGHRVLKPWLGFTAGWVFLISKLAAGGTVALGFAGYLASLFPAIPERPTAVAAVIFLTAVNLFGIHKSGLLNIFIVSISVFALSFFVIAGIPTFTWDNLQPFAPQGTGGILRSAALLFFAYTGYARLATLGEEVRDPKQTIPKAIMLALGIAALLYFAVALIAVGNVGSQAMADSLSPIETASHAFIFPTTSVIVAVGATTAMLGVLLSQLLGISRMMFAMARRGDLPAWLENVNKRNAVPTNGIFVTSFFLILVAVFGTLEFIVAAAAFTILLYYAIANLAALRMDEKDRLFPIWVPWLGFFSCLALAATLEFRVIALGMGLLVLGFIWRWAYRSWAKK